MELVLPGRTSVAIARVPAPVPHSSIINTSAARPCTITTRNYLAHPLRNAGVGNVRLTLLGQQAPGMRVFGEKPPAEAGGDPNRETQADSFPVVFQKGHSFCGSRCERIQSLARCRQ